MWILFALTSATILASRKIQEKRLVDTYGQSLGWMIRTGSAITVILIWLLFSRDTIGIDAYQAWIVVGIIALIMYPIQTYTYYRAMRDMPLSVFGLLAPTVFLSTTLFSYLFLSQVPSTLGLVGIVSVSIGSIFLLPKKKEKSQKHISGIVFLIAITAYVLMGLGSVMDKIAMQYMSLSLYAMLNQGCSAISMMVLSFFIYKDTDMKKSAKDVKMVMLIGALSGVAWFLGVYSIQISPNVAYSVALINMYALFTTIYGVYILKEGVTREKIIAFIFMAFALIAFAFA